MKKIKEADKGYISLDIQTNDSDFWLSSISYISATKFVDNQIIDSLHFPIKIHWKIEANSNKAITKYKILNLHI